MFTRSLFAALTLIPLLLVSRAAAEEDQAGADSVIAGHSYHGEAFNQGPRQAAVLIPGMAAIDFPTSTTSQRAQQFVEQGVAQLHGFWYLEAERSFRQAAAEDPQLAIAYWGMALANVNNDRRARGLIDQAMKRRGKGADKREKLYIEALDRLIPKNNHEDSSAENQPDKPAEREAKQKRIERYLADLEEILHEYPDDLEAKAFLVVNLWTGDRQGVKLTSRYAVDALLSEIFAQNPMHPAHHYRIHLWDSPRAENALQSAANCGPSSPGIAHMWHMPGHIYSKLKRYGDAAWQQEASARVDHAHMIRTQLMPDQIHNFAHNNEWLVRNLLFIGRVDDALDLSRNLVSLPRHPTYNSLAQGGSYKYGRQRLLQTLSQYGLWQELIDERNAHNSTPGNGPGQQDWLAQQVDWQGWLAVAQFMTNDRKAGGETLRSLRRQSLALQNELLDLADVTREGGDQQAGGEQVEPQRSRDQIKKHLGQLRQAIARGAAAAATRRKDVKALKRHAAAAKLDKVIQAQWLAEAGDLKGAISLAEQAVKEGQSEVRPLAVLVDSLWRKHDTDQAKKKFGELRQVAAAADINTPMLAKLVPVAQAIGVEGDWRIAAKPAADLGQRPPLDDLGPFRWQPYAAPSWNAKSAAGEPVSGLDFDGRPRIVIFYLGFGCLHCVEQLHVFAPKLDEFKAAGIELVALSSESVEELQKGINGFEGKMEIPLMSADDRQAFKSFRAWDDFEDQPLHGTFLIDAQNRVRWQDIGHEPFMDADFLLQESKRLLSLP